jgi:hypothetical protein
LLEVVILFSLFRSSEDKTGDEKDNDLLSEVSCQLSNILKTCAVFDTFWKYMQYRRKICDFTYVGLRKTGS